jgi:hypothetical protein
MEIRGWVYVISNAAMPGLVKVGYSTKDPQLRAEELAGTGVPHPYVVERELLAFSPREIEQEVHARLAHRREGKEWFKCGPDEAWATILQVAGSRRIALPSEHKTSTAGVAARRDYRTGRESFYEEAMGNRSLFSNPRGTWTLSKQSLHLTHKETGKQLSQNEYTYDGEGIIKGFAVKDHQPPWVRLEDVEFVD